MFFLFQEIHFIRDSVAAGFATRYELPDGNSIELPVDYQAVPELLFNPNFLPVTALFSNY